MRFEFVAKLPGGIDKKTTNNYENTANVFAKESVPLTANSDAYVSKPAMFSAIHLIRPRCSFSTEAMFSTLDLADSLLIVMPFSPDMIGSLLSVHLIWMGRSPLTIMQETPVLSPVLNDSSPKVNGIICGRTIQRRVFEN